MKVSWASPFAQSADNNKALLDSLNDYQPTQYSKPFKPRIQVPVFGDVDVTDILKANEKMKPAAAESHEDGSNTLATSTEIASDEDHPPQFLVSVSEMIPQNRQQQLTTVLFQNCPSLNKNAMEKVLLLFSLLLSENSLVQWCHITEHDLANVNGVFVRFSSVRWVRKMRSCWEQLKSAFDVEYVCEEQGLDDSSPVDTALLLKVTAEISGIIANKKNSVKSTSKTGTEDLDEVMKYYRTYKVENSELVEVPRELKTKIVKEIIKFRSKVLTIERDARKREIELESKKAKARITQIYQGIKEARQVGQDDSAAAAVEQQEMDDSKNQDPLDLMSDEEYERYLADKKAIALKAAYEERLAKMHQLELAQKSSLLQQLHNAQSYEDNLMENKFSYLEDYKQFVEPQTNSRNPVLSTNLQLYFNDHSEYLRVRSLQRSAEEEKDKLDEEDELQQQKESQTVAPVPRASESNDSKSTDFNDIVISELSPAVLESINEKTGELIEEYLGIREEVLVEFIIDFIKEHNLTKKDSLITELQETLDEDSKNVVNSLYSFIQSQIKK